MVRQAWLDHVSIPTDNVHRMRGELEPAQAAADYEQVLRAFFSLPLVGLETHHKTPPPRFDLILLGMGDDGHTASLFPGAAAIREQRRWVVADYVEKLGAWRVTLTPAVINAAADVIFLVSGPGKAERLRQVLAEPRQPDQLPAQIVRPARGRLRWLVDAAAATLWQRD
jgi:6-phosphogluconolactonase